MLKQKNRSLAGLGAYLRMHFDWHIDLTRKEKDAIQDRADHLIKAGEAYLKNGVIDDDPEFDELIHMIEPTLLSIRPFDDSAKNLEKAIGKLVKDEIPAWKEFGEGVRGFGAASLGAIIGEAGDLSLYPKKGHLWKRMGLAVFDGIRQGGLSKSAKKEDWIAHGYNRERRSKMYVIGENLVRQGEHYRDVYLRRKEYEISRAEAHGLTVAPSASIPKKDAAKYMSKGHVDKRAQRYMEKKLLRDLLQAWKEAA